MGSNILLSSITGGVGMGSPAAVLVVKVTLTAPSPGFPTSPQFCPAI